MHANKEVLTEYIMLKITIDTWKYARRIWKYQEGGVVMLHARYEFSKMRYLAFLYKDEKNLEKDIW